MIKALGLPDIKLSCIVGEFVAPNTITKNNLMRYIEAYRKLRPADTLAEVVTTLYGDVLEAIEDMRIERSLRLTNKPSFRYIVTLLDSVLIEKYEVDKEITELWRLPDGSVVELTRKHVRTVYIE